MPIYKEHSYFLIANKNTRTIEHYVISKDYIWEHNTTLLLPFTSTSLTAAMLLYTPTSCIYSISSSVSRWPHMLAPRVLSHPYTSSQTQIFHVSSLSLVWWPVNRQHMLWQIQSQMHNDLLVLKHTSEWFSLAANEAREEIIYHLNDLENLKTVSTSIWSCW